MFVWHIWINRKIIGALNQMIDNPCLRKERQAGELNTEKIRLQI